MRRDLRRLADERFDVGGGVFGVSVAREAAPRGLAVALATLDQIRDHAVGGFAA